MKLAVQHRVSEKKGEIKQMRRAGNIPAILYSPQGVSEKLIVNNVEFQAILRGLKSGHLSTTLFTLNDGAKTRRAIVKDIQYDLTTYNILHIDFEEILDTVPVCVKVPVECIGIADCVGIKLGGFLRQVARYVKVECLPTRIPQAFQVDVMDLGIRQSKRLKDIAIPEGVRALSRPEEVLVVIAKGK